MKKKEIKSCLKVYSKLKDGLKEGKTEFEIKEKGRKRKLSFSEDIYKIKEYVEELMISEWDPLVKTVIHKSVIEGRNDRAIVMKLPISESTYYRWKRRFTEKIYELYIAEGYVSKEEILKDSISD